MRDSSARTKWLAILFLASSAAAVAGPQALGMDPLECARDGFARIVSGEETARGPASVRIQCWKEDTCHTNSYEVLRELSKTAGFKTNQAQVLYITDFAGFNYHVIVRVGDYIYDAAHIDNSVVAPIRVSEYFGKIWVVRPSSRVRVIPGDVYLGEYFPSTAHPRGRDYFLAGLLDDGYEPPASALVDDPSDRFQTLPLTDYVRQF